MPLPGVEARLTAAEIEAGATRPAAAIIADVTRSGEELTMLWSSLPDDTWDRPVRAVSGREFRLGEMPTRRWQELWIHLVALELARRFLIGQKSSWRPSRRHGLTLAERLPVGAERPSSLTEREELAWLFGRLSRPDLPELSPWE
jgi:hypothetical protein